MRDFREHGDEKDALIFALGAAGGFALGLLLSGRIQPKQRAQALGGAVGRRVRDLRDVAARLRPARLRREPVERTDLTMLEDAVLAAFVADEVLGERGIDIGAISRGIIELSGTVHSEAEAERAVRLARRTRGVTTVVNRLAVTRAETNTGGDGAEDVTEMAEWQGRRGGMGRRRQGRQTDPDRSDDSRHIAAVALEDADRAQFADEGYGRYPRNAERPEPPRRGKKPRYDEDELDNQTPAKAKAGIIDEDQPSGAPTVPVGEGAKPGVELALEAADVPVKPHGKAARGGSGSGSAE